MWNSGAFQRVLSTVLSGYEKLHPTFGQSGPKVILVITAVDNTAPTRQLDLRLAVAVILLIPTIWFTWLTANGLVARRQLRTDLAELSHVRYGLLNAERWRDIKTAFSKSLPIMPALCVPSVSTPPGAIALTRIFRGPNSAASPRVIASTAPLVPE